MDLLEEVRLNIAVKNEIFRSWATQYHNAKVKNKTFKVGDMVLKKLEATSIVEGRGELAPKWYESFRVIRVIKSNIYHL